MVHHGTLVCIIVKEIAMSSRNAGPSFFSRPTFEKTTLFVQKSRVLLAAIVILMSIGALGVGVLVHFAAPKAHAAGGAGASLPYVEMEAHTATTTGSILGPSFTLGDLANDAVDRQAVQLTQGKYVQFTLPQAANSINLRYSIPDSSSGGGQNASLSIYINGTKQSSDLQLTSQYGWVYGTPDFSNCYTTWSNTPGGTPHHMFDEVHVLLPEMAKGATVKLQVDSENTAQWYAIDVADFQEVPTALTQPSGSISVTDSPYNADPTGAVDATQAIQNAVNAGQSQGKTVWIPKGTFKVTDHIIVDHVTLTGAGYWYSVLTGAPTNGNNTGVGVFGKNANPGDGSGASSNVTLSNFAIEGQITQRSDCYGENGVGGALNNSTISNLWIEHTKVGMWFDGPFSGLTITGSRIDGTMADGINFHQGISNSSVSQSIIRGTGDDGLALWSDIHQTANGDSNDTFDHNTVQSPWVANDIAIYGGTGNSATNNYVSGSQYRGGGIMVDYENFGSWTTAPFGGTTTVSNNTINQIAGFGDQGIQQFGALMYWADSGSMNATFTASGLEIDNSQYAAIQFDGGNSISNVAMSDINISGAEFAFANKVSTVTGSASNVTASGLTVNSMESCESAGSFNITLGSGNSGWSASSQTCGFPPPPTPGSGTATPTFTNATATPTIAIPTPTPVSGKDVVAINAGGSASGSFVADTDFDQGTAYSDTSSTISTSGDSNPAPQAVYQTCRWNSSFTYTIPGLVSGSSYTVLLHWAELSFQTSGARTFNVSVNGNQVLSNFDVFANAGYKVGISRAFSTTANGNGQIVIAFSKGTADNPFISGIEILSSSSVTATPSPNTPTPVPTQSSLNLITAINAGGSASGSYVADTDYNQGNTYSDTSSTISTSADSNPAPQAVYQTCRWNSAFTYTIPGLTSGTTYTIRLHWAELSFQTSGARKFNVAINGNQVLSNFDVYATAGYKVGLGKTFTATPNSSGQIVIAFTQGSADNPFISGIEILAPQGVATPTPTPAPQLMTAINAGGSASGSYVADTDYNQGNQYSDTSTAINTGNGLDSNPAPQFVYQTCRWNSSFTYTIPGLTAGATYTVRLHWAELSFQTAGARTFNVAINGSQVLSNFDVYATAALPIIPSSVASKSTSSAYFAPMLVG
jgi:Malectin domain